MSFTKKLAVLCFSASLALGTLSVPFLPQSAYAQTTSGNLTGTVTDSTGAAVANAKVTATNLATDVALTATTNASGDYLIQNLPAGKYNLSATAAGFSKYTLQNLNVEVNRTATAKLTLAVAGASTSVEVTAIAAQTIDTTTAQLQQTFETKELQDLPTASAGLGVLNLSLLAPGVGSSGGIGAGTGPSIGGQRPRNNNFTVEGIDNNNKSVTGPLINVPNDSVQEFTLLTNQFSPEFGHSTGGQFNVVVASGTNSLHGRAYEYFQNRDLNAIDQTTIRAGYTSNQRYDNNRFGGQVGGPILKNKLFYYGAFEYQPIGQSVVGSTCTPTASGFSTINAVNGLNATNLGVLNQYVTPSTLPGSPENDPNDVANACAVQEGAPLTPGGNYAIGISDPAGNIVPAEVGLFPITGATYQNNEAIVASGDWTISPKDNFRGRYIYNKQNTLDTAAYLPTFWSTLPSRYQLIALTEYHNFTPNITNEFRLGYNRYYNDTPVGNFNFPGLDMFPNLTFEDMGAINVGPDGNAPQSTIQNLYQATDNVTWVKGNHSLKFGFDGRKYISPQSFTQRVRGDYYWYNTDEYLHDLAPSEFGERSSGNFFYYGDQTAWYGFANDSWRVSPTITLNYGLRYEFTSVPYGEREQAINSAASVPGLISFTKPEPQKWNFLPRIGIAWAPGNGDWSIRGGFGMGVDVLYDNLGILSLPPQYSSTEDVGNPGYPAAGDPNFLANGGLPPGSGGLQTFDTIADQRAATSAYVPNQKLPYSEQWNLGVQHVFAKNYTAEVRYVGTRGIHLSVQDRLNRQIVVTPNNYLPTFLAAPSQAELDGMKTLNDVKAAGSSFVPAYEAAGFTGNNVVGFMPYGSSNYQGLQTQLQRRFERGLQFNIAYTWSKTMDNSTADVFSTVLTPRRAQDWNNWTGEYSRSALDHKNRLTAQFLWDIPYLKNSHNWMARNLVGNWEIAPIWTMQTGEFATATAGIDANLNGDSAGDRAVINPLGKKGVGTGTTTLKNTGGDIVGYVANNPDAYYIAAGQGALSTASRNTLELPRTNDWDVTALKRINFTERYAFEFSAGAFNVFNHPQYVSGYLNQINSFGDTSSLATNFLKPQSAAFNNPRGAFPSNARTMQLGAKFVF